MGSRQSHNEPLERRACNKALRYIRVECRRQINKQETHGVHAPAIVLTGMGMAQFVPAKADNR